MVLSSKNTGKFGYIHTICPTFEAKYGSNIYVTWHYIGIFVSNNSKKSRCLCHGHKVGKMGLQVEGLCGVMEREIMECE